MSASMVTTSFAFVKIHSGETEPLPSANAVTRTPGTPVPS